MHRLSTSASKFLSERTCSTLKQSKVKNKDNNLNLMCVFCHNPPRKCMSWFHKELNHSKSNGIKKNSKLNWVFANCLCIKLESSYTMVPNKGGVERKWSKAIPMQMFPALKASPRKLPIIFRNSSNLCNHMIKPTMKPLSMKGKTKLVIKNWYNQQSHYYFENVYYFAGLPVHD